MPAMTTVFIEAQGSGESKRQYQIDGHTVVFPRLILQKRTEPASSTGTAVDKVNFVYGAADAAGEPLSSRINFEVRAVRPANARSTEMDLAKAALRDYVASTNFDDVLSAQTPLK